MCVVFSPPFGFWRGRCARLKKVTASWNLKPWKSWVYLTRGQVQIASCVGIKTAGAQGEKGDPVKADCVHWFLRRNDLFLLGWCHFQRVSNREMGAPILSGDISLRSWLASWRPFGDDMMDTYGGQNWDQRCMVSVDRCSDTMMGLCFFIPSRRLKFDQHQWEGQQMKVTASKYRIFTC